MSRTFYLTCPPIRSGKPKLGETRTLPSGDLEYKEAISGDWKPAVRLNDVRGTLIANAAVQGAYTHDRGAGKEAYNVTAYLPADKDFGGDFDYRPPELKQIERRADQHKKKAEGVKTHLGRVLLDPYDYPIRNFPELPATLSTEMRGWEVEYHLRKNLAIKPYDLMALCMSSYTDGRGKFHEGPPRIASLIEKASKFRRKAGLPSLKTKPGSFNIINYVKSLLPQGAETLEDLKGDLKPGEVKASRAMNAGRYPNRRRKAKREEEARAREEQTNQLGERERHQSAQVDSSYVAAVTRGNSADANVGSPSVGVKVKESRGVKRGLGEVSPEAYPEERPQAVKIQWCETVASGMEDPSKRRVRQTRNANTLFEQLQQAARDFPQSSIEVDTLQPGFQEDEASFNESYPWSAHAFDTDEVGTRKIAGQSRVIESKPWRATKTLDENLYSSLVDDINAARSKPGRVRGHGLPENNNSRSYASYHTDQYTSHSNLPAYDMAAAESSEWIQTYNTSYSDFNTTAAPQSSPDHLMASAFTNANPANHQYPYQDTYRHSERARSSGFSYYNTLSSNENPYTNPTVRQSAISAAHSTTSEAVFPASTVSAAAGDDTSYSRDQQSQNDSCRPVIGDTLKISSPSQNEADITGISD